MLKDIDTTTVSGKVRYGGRVLFGVAGGCASIAAVVFSAPAVYRGASELNAKATETTTPDGVPLKSLSVSAADKFGGGLCAFLTSTSIVYLSVPVSMFIGGLITDCVVSAVESCCEGVKSCCQATAAKCNTAGDCIKKAFGCNKDKGKGDVRMDPPAIVDAREKV